MSNAALTFPARLRALLGRLPSAAGRAPPVNHVALGTFCHGAAALRALGLRRWTGPLDWIFSTPAMIAECLRDDFATLLDPEHLASVPPSELMPGAARQCRHRLYETRYGLPTLFNHHDPVTSRADRLALGRAVARLRQALDGPSENRLYMLSERAWPETEIEAVEEALRRRRGLNRLMVITVEPEAVSSGWSVEVDGLTARATLATRSRSRGKSFADPRDDALLGELLGRLAGDVGPVPNEDRALNA